jgi:hypothetical protein
MREGKGVRFVVIVALSLALVTGCRRTGSQPEPEPPDLINATPEQKGDVVEKIEPSDIVGICMYQHIPGVAPPPGVELRIDPPYPYSGLRAEIKPLGKEESVLKIKTDNNGKFRAELPPGKYLLCVDDDSRFPFTFEVEPKKMIEEKFIIRFFAP